MIYFGGDSFMYGEGLEDKEDFPYLVSTPRIAVMISLGTPN